MPKASIEELERLRQDLIADAELNLNFLVLTVSACLIATLGLLTNSTAVIIGAMIIAPLMLPLRSLAFASLEADFDLFTRSLRTIGGGTIAAFLIAWFIGRVFSLPASEFGTEILARTQPNLADLGIAIAAGAVSGFAKIKTRISDAVAGTAIAVALMPPLCVIGIALSQGDWGGSRGAFLLYLTNLLGITFACMLVFAWAGYYLNLISMRRALLWAVAMISLLVIPLFISLTILLKQKQLQSNIKLLLKNQTITVGRQVELINTQVNWNSIPWNNQPSTVILTVRTNQPVTPKQVKEIENFLYRKLRRDFRVIFRVSEFQEVTSEKLHISH